MLYQKDFTRQRPLKFSTPGLQIFAKTRLKLPTQQKFQNLMLRFASPNTSIHGVHYVFGCDQHRWERSLWAVILVAAICGSVVMYMMLSTRHNQQQLKTVVENSRMPVYDIEFPAVAVCPFNHVNWMRLKTAEDRFLPPTASNSTRQAFREVVIGLESLVFGNFDELSRLKLSLEDVRVIDNFISITELAKFMAFRCEEILVSCVFDGTMYDCCKIFLAERTEFGMCLVFNSLISEDSKKKKITDQHYPWETAKAGESSGLQFNLSYNHTYYRPNNGIPFAVDVMIKEADEWSDQTSYILSPNTYNSLSIDPQMTVVSENLRGLTPEKRQCLYSDEKSSKYNTSHGLMYNKNNCITNCKQEYLLKVCNCTIPLFFPNTATKQRECTASDYICIYENRDIFSYYKLDQQDSFINDSRRGMTCDCIQSCQSLIFHVTMSTHWIKDANDSLPGINVDIYFVRSILTKYVTNVEYSLMDLLANFGGILQLFMGASVLSLAELLYYIIQVLLIAIQDRRIIYHKFKKRLFG